MGDRNTKGFHKSANVNRRYNLIEKLKINEEVVEDKEIIKREIIKYYSNLYKEKEGWRHCFKPSRPRLNEVDKEALQRPFSEEE